MKKLATILIGLGMFASAFAVTGTVGGTGSAVEADRGQAITEATAAANAQIQSACTGTLTNVHTINSDATQQADGYHAFVAVQGTCRE